MTLRLRSSFDKLRTNVAQGRTCRLTAFLVVLLFPSLAAAQRVDAEVRGTVADDAGGALPGATVTALDRVTGVVRVATTDGDGHYTLHNLPASTYDLRADLSGFAASVREAQALHVGTSIRVDLVLKVALAAAVTVKGDPLPLETTRHTPSRLVQRDEIDSLAVANRNFNDLAALAPGVTKTGVYGGVDIDGNRDFQNGYLIDGVSAERQRLGDQQLAYAQDWIQEFQVLTGQFTAEFGQAAGGVVNVITRSGGNELEGRAYGFFRNEAWDARPQFAQRKPPLDEHRLGGTLGGPLLKDRVFYFAGLEHLSSDSNSIVASTFVEANGTFPSTLDRTVSLLKVDAVATAAQRLRFRYAGQRESTTGSSVGGISTEEHGRDSDDRANDVAGNWTWIASPTMVNEVRASWNTSLPSGGCTFATRNPPGTWFERLYPGAQFGCPVNFGSIGENQFELVENLSWTHGRHDFKLGGQAAWTRSFGDFRNVRDGRYSFERDVPFDLANPASYPFSFVIIEGTTTWNTWGAAGGLFVQDSWRVTDRLTLNMGVRYDLDASLTALTPLARIDKGLHTFALDPDNVSPRIGAAWLPFGTDARTLIRGGVGLYYDQNHNNVTTSLLLNNILVDRLVFINANSPQLNPFWPDIPGAKRFLAEGLARNGIPDLPALNGIAGATNDVDRKLEIPATRQVSAGVVHTLGWMNASVDVMFAHGVDLYVIRDVNLDPVSFRRVNPNYSAISTFGNGGTSDYRGLQVQANVIPNSRHLLKLAYTLARNRSNTNATLSSGAATNPFDYSEDEGPTDNDVRHILAVNGITSLPLDVQLSGIVSYRSALPYSATTNAPRPDGKPFAYRPEPRNSRRGDSALSLDVRVAKTVRLPHGSSAMILAEMFNLTNAVNYADYIGTITSSQFGQPTTAGPKRRLQLGFRVDF